SQPKNTQVDSSQPPDPLAYSTLQSTPPAPLQPPQRRVSVVMSTSQPFSNSPSQFAKPDSQLVITQPPSLQPTSVTCKALWRSAVQSLAQSPQKRRSLARSRSQPLATN